MNENERIDDAVQAQEDHNSMVESVIDRQPRFADDPAAEAAFQRLDAAARKRRTEMNQPQATDFTEILPMVADRGPGKHVIRVKLDSGANILVAEDLDIEEAERRELAITQAMIEYRTKRNGWEKQITAQPLSLLNQYVDGGMDYADAEDRVQRECNLSAKQVTALRARYDRPVVETTPPR